MEITFKENKHYATIILYGYRSLAAHLCRRCGRYTAIFKSVVGNPITCDVKLGKRKRINIPIYLDIDEINAMLSAARNLRDYTLVYLAYKTGLRCHELTSLKIEDIDFKDGIITVVNGKGEKDRQVLMDDDLKEKLLDYIGDRREGIVFLSGKKTASRTVRRTVYTYDEMGNVIDSQTKLITLAPRQMNDATVERIIRKMARDAGIKKAKPVTTHTLRHTFACQCLLNGIPITTVQMALGHSSLRTTEIYLKAIQTRKQLKRDFNNHPLPDPHRTDTKEKENSISSIDSNTPNKPGTLKKIRFCPYCGGEIDLPKQPVFCPYCGERLIIQ